MNADQSLGHFDEQSLIASNKLLGFNEYTHDSARVNQEDNFSAIDDRFIMKEDFSTD